MTSDTPSFAKDIQPLFCRYDRDMMRFAFDLWAYQEVKQYAAMILERLELGDMPCDRAWPQGADRAVPCLDDGRTTRPDAPGAVSPPPTAGNPAALPRTGSPAASDQGCRAAWCPSYSVRISPRCCSTGTTWSTNSSSPPGRYGGWIRNPSTPRSSNQSCIWSAISSPVPITVRWPPRAGIALV